MVVTENEKKFVIRTSSKNVSELFIMGPKRIDFDLADLKKVSKCKKKPPEFKLKPCKYKKR